MERWSLAFGYTPDPWLHATLLACGTIAIAEAISGYVRSRRRAPRVARLLLFGLRVLAILAVMAIAFELTLRIDQVVPMGRRLVVLVDRSASMSIPDGNPPTSRQSRLETLWRASADARQAWIEDGLNVDVRGFDSATTPYVGDVAETLAVVPNGNASALAHALTELDTPIQPGQTPIAAVLVLSDGLVVDEETGSMHLDTVAKSLGVPITTVSLGAAELLDVSIAEVRAGDFAFVENLTRIDATLVSHGYADETVRVELRRDHEVVGQQSIRLGANGVPIPVRFEVIPDRVGAFVYEVVVSPLPSEATVENNRRAFVVKVLRDKVRVLHVAGRPDWDVRALRTLLRRDPNVELLSYYILRGIDDIQREDESAPLSLIPFPTDDLFRKELDSFDLIVLHNFDAVPHDAEQYIDDIAEYVLAGGALVLIGGDLAFSDGGYAEPSMADILPIDVRRRIPSVGGRYRPKLTEAGHRHPLTAWLGSDGWEHLPELDTFNPLDPSPPDGPGSVTTLLAHPEARDRTGAPRPVLSISEPGRGRVLVLASGSTWRLGFAPDLSLVEGDRPYDLLWLTAVRWLLHDDSSGRLQLETDKPRYREGEVVELFATTIGPSYAPEAGVDVAWEVVPLDADEGATPVREGTWTSDAFGRARSELAGLPVGPYAALARRERSASEDADATAPRADEREARRVFIVDPPGRELAHLDATSGTATLQAVADATGGQALSALGLRSLPRRLPVADRRTQPDLRVSAREDHPIWSGWSTLGVLLLALGGEWILRRRGAGA